MNHPQRALKCALEGSMLNDLFVNWKAALSKGYSPTCRGEMQKKGLKHSGRLPREKRWESGFFLSVRGFIEK